MMSQRSHKTPLRAAIYTRISQDRTGAGLGVERQREDCEKLAKREGMNVVAVLSDNDISAYSGKRRPGYDALLDMVRDNEVDVVLTWHVDRLHRSMQDLEDYIEACDPKDESGSRGRRPSNRSIPTLTVKAGDLDLSTATGRMIARVLGSVARHESEQKAERVARARRQAAESGQAHGHLGYGYDDDQRIIPAESAIVQEVAERVLDGETLYSIAGDLTLRGIPTPGAGQWRWQHVRNIVTGRGSFRDFSTAQIAAIRTLAGDGSAAGPADRSLVLEGWPELGSEAADRLAALGAETAIGYGGLAAALTEAGVPAPATTWRSANLGKMIQRGTLCGWRDFRPGTNQGGGPMVARGAWEAILDKEVTERLRAILNAPGRRVQGRHPLYLLTGTLACGRCGFRLVGVTDNRSGRRRYQCTKIPGTDRCGGLTVSAEPVDEMVTAAVLDVLGDSAFRAGKKTARPENLDEALVALAALDQEERDWRSDLARGLIDRGTFRDAVDGIRNRRKPHERAVGAASPTVTAALAGVPVARDQLNAWWEAAPTEAKRQVIRVLIDRVEIARVARRGYNVFDPARVGAPEWRA